MVAQRATLEEALASFQMLRNHSPYRFGGVWFVAKTGESEWTAYRTKKAAFRNVLRGETEITRIKFGG